MTVNQQKVFINVVKMLKYRKWLIKDARIQSTNNEHIFHITIDSNLKDMITYKSGDTDDMVDDKIYILYLDQKITSINKFPQIGEFLKKYENNHKMLIIDEIVGKTKQLITLNKYSEVFLIYELMINIVEYIYCPQYEVLEDENAYCKEYKVTKNQLPKLHDSDPIAKYLFLKRGQIVRIIRNSKNTGKSVSYRIVINK